LLFSNDFYAHYSAPINPCHGCISAACASCPCADERPDIAGELKRLRMQKEKKQAVAPPAKRKSGVYRFEEFDLKEYVPLPEAIFGKLGKSVVLRADSDGMRNAGIHTGDHLVFDTELKPTDGDIVVAMVNGQKVCHRYFRDGAQYRIRREDGVTPDIITDDCTVYAVLVGMIRQCRCPA